MKATRQVRITEEQPRSVVTVPSDRMAFGVRELADSLGLSSGFIRLEIARGRLHGIKRGHRVLIPRASVEAYLQAD